MKAEDLVIGNKYVPHAKSVCGDLESSVVWRRAKTLDQPYLYYTGVNSGKHMFNETYNPSGDYFLPSDVTPYVELKVGDPLPVELLERYREAGGEITHAGVWSKDNTPWEYLRRVGDITEYEGRKAIRTQGYYIDYNKMIEVMLNNKPTQVKQKTQTISRQGFKELYDIVCHGWRDTIVAIIDENKFSDTFEVSNDLILKAYKEADSAQKKVLNKYFTEPEEEFNASMLKVGEMMEVTDEGTFKGNVLIRAYNNIVNLNDVSDTWSTDCNWKGKKLEKGERVTIVAK